MPSSDAIFMVVASTNLRWPDTTSERFLAPFCLRFAGANRVSGDRATDVFIVDGARIGTRPSPNFSLFSMCRSFGIDRILRLVPAKFSQISLRIDSAERTIRTGRRVGAFLVIE
jgi:hypothetical protein